ncbi:MAG: cysteine-rich small domain-containing protein [Clostridiales bacterium]|nr:cysteine-rich small domain-containing protein [Clostridiales bacterium]
MKASTNWRECEYSFFSHRKCEAFPCHETKDEENFNCLFCYCPLYLLGEKCGGRYAFLSNGIKDCSACAYPHERESYGAITTRFKEIAAKMARE